MKKADKDRLDILHTMPCEACGGMPVEVHHMINQDNKTRDHQRTIPLCQDPFGESWGCHRGPFSIHKTRKSFRARYGHEDQMLERVNARLEGK